MIHTERLLLRGWQPEDLAPYAAMNADLRVREFFPSVLTPAQSEAEIRRFTESLARDGFCLFAAELRSTGQLAGFIGIQTMNFAVPGLAQPAVEIGWRLAYSCWGQGLAEEGARSVLNFAFDECGLTEIVAITVPANLRSRRVMDKLRMTHQPQLDFDHPRLAEGHPLRRHVLYSIAKSVAGP